MGTVRDGAMGAEDLEVVVLVGLPGSGKTTFYFSRLAATHDRVSLDELGTRARELAAFRACLAAGRSVAVDDTNLTRAHRRRWLEAAAPYGARAVCYWFRAPVTECLARNALRPGESRVPPVAIYTAARRLEPPTGDEGFAALYVVETLVGEFQVRPL